LHYKCSREGTKKAADLSQSPQSTPRRIKNLCDLSGLCEITKKCLQLSKFLMAEIRTNSGKAILDATALVGLRRRQLDA
jgi:hypothetical protein